MAGDQKEKAKTRSLSCGLIMPISAIDGCATEHWSEVKNLICEAVESIADPIFSVKLVSDSDDVGVIQKRIVQNIYNSDIVICDVSGKNPNVMFELGMRLAFDKPTIIVKDDKTDYSFDTGIIEHVPYPRDLRFGRIVAFKQHLIEKVVATHKAAQSDPGHSTFLKNFGKFQVANLTESVVPADRLMIDMLQDIQLEMASLRRLGMREKNGKTVADSTMVLAAALHTYRLKNPSLRISDMAKSEEFYSEMEKLADAPRYFSGPSHFREAVEDLLKAAGRAEERIN